jgi:cellulose synthase operon protein C
MLRAVRRLPDHLGMTDVDPQAFRSQIDALVEQLAARDPNPSALWVGESRTLDEIHQRAAALLDNHGVIDSTADSEATARRVRLFVLDRVAAAAALLEVAGRSKDARTLLERCADACPDPGNQKLYRAGVGDLAAYAKLVRAKWLWSYDKFDEARRLAATLSTAAPPIAEVARMITKAPTPIKDAPALFSLNGFGARLYGEVDPEPDGSHVKVRFVTALFVPILPIDAYRLTSHGDGYNIRGKVPLGLIMRVWQLGALALLALALTWTIVSSFLNSPERQLRLAVDDVVALEPVDPEAALERYEALASEYNGIESDDDLLGVAQGWVRMATAGIVDPITPAAVDQVTSIVDRFSALPSRMQREALAKPFVDRLLDWSDQLDTSTPEGADARLDLLLAAHRFAAAGDRQRVNAGIAATRMALAAQLAVDWPLEALHQYAQLVDSEPEARTAITQILAELPDSPTLFAELIPQLDLWAPHVGESDKARAADLGRRGLALAQDPERTTMLQANDEVQLRAALALDPTDQVVVVALADLQRARGQLDEAVAQLEALGKPGLMIHDAQYLLASAQFDRGRDEQAASLLEQMLRNRLPAFEDARRAFEGEFDRLRASLVAKAEAGQFPPKYKAALTGTNNAAGQEAFGQWLGEEIERSPAIARLQTEYQRQSDIVPVAILLGTVQLQRAHAATGEQREQLLDSAQSTFLSIGSEATGMPDYHLALGQVYFRLGKNALAKAEFQHLLDNPDGHVQLLAASGYRDLGQFDEARKVSEVVYAAGVDETVKHRAAVLRSLLAFDLDERRTWLERANQDDEYVRTNLLEVQAEELSRAGNFDAADKKYAEAYELQAAQAERTHGSYNNAALSLMGRHYCTGDRRHIDQAVELMQRSVALRPDDGIIMLNYASVLDTQARLGLLDRFIPTDGVHVSSGEVAELLRELSHSRKRDELLAAIHDDAARVRALDAWSRGETLSPQQPAVYFGQLSWHLLAEQPEAASKLLERARTVEGIDTSDLARGYAEGLDGSTDEQTLQDLNGKLAARVAAREQSKRAGVVGQAALLQLDGGDYYQRASLQVGEAALVDARAAVEAYEAAQARWPEGLSTASLSDALLLLAMLEIEARDPSSAAQWLERRRKDGITLTLVSLIDERSPVLDELQKHPSFQRSLELRRVAPESSLRELDLVLAKIVGDQALRLRTLVQLDKPVNRIGLEVAELFSPFDTVTARIYAWTDAERG